ncbi:hypothetical protein KAT08_02940 [Candidatus Babeliales bacterium]|nr:hypothetical protein [Candidatus Babeliales bacterium]
MTKEKKEFEGLLKIYQNHAKKNGFRLNPNKKIKETLIIQLIKRENKFGKKYCPCRRISGNEIIDKKNICPCIYHKKEIEEQGHCHCFLFIK